MTILKQYVPFVDRKKVAEKLQEYVFLGNYFTEFTETKKFEQKLKEILGVKYCSVVPNGTLALILGLKALGVEPGDKVIIPNLTMYATQAAVELIGAIPILIDIDPFNLCLDLNRSREYIRKNSVKAVIYVTLNGRSHGAGELQEFYDFCRTYKIKILEDNCQSLGSKRNDEKFISCPKEGIGVFSFSPQKIITTGQGGCLVTNEDYYGEKIKKLKDFGRERGGVDIHEEFGINAKFTDLQAVLGLVQLEDFEKRIQSKKAIYGNYRKYLGDLPQKIHFINTNLDFATPWFVDIFVENRDDLFDYLLKKGIQTRKIYPYLSEQKINENKKGNKTDFFGPKKGLWLPSSIDMSGAKIKEISLKIKEFLC